MPYEKQTWATGDIVTSSKLNHMEDGIAGAGGGLVVGMDLSSMAMDKTWQQIYDAPFAVLKVIDPTQNVTTDLISAAIIDGSDYTVLVNTIINQGSVTQKVFVAQSATDYPVLAQ